jgi:Zn-dependent metalloprotease
MKVNLIKAFLVLSLFQSWDIKAQIRFSESQKDEKGNYTFIKIAGDDLTTVSDENEQKLLHQLSGNDPALQFRYNTSIKDNFGFIHKGFKTYLNNIEVLGIDYVIHEKDNVVIFANGSYETIGNISLKPIISETVAIEKAVKYFNSLEKNVIDKSIIGSNKGLIICRDYFNKTNFFILCYKIHVQGESDASAKYIYVNTSTGTIINVENFICTVNVPGTVQTRYSGNNNIISDLIGGQFRLREVRNNVNILTLNANHQTNPEAIINTATDFFDNDNNWLALEHGDDRIAHDVHWASENILDYWRIVHNRNSINNAGMQVRNFVHVNNPNTGGFFDNAYWDPNSNSMYYGDGLLFFPLVSLDICSHEIGHGVAQFTIPGGFNSSGEAAALNEGFSDIWGACIEAWTAPNKQRWLLGEEIMPNVIFNCIRNMQNPKAVNAAEGQHPNTYLQQFWDTGGEPHVNSTILSHWFFLITEGGSGTNDIGSNFNVFGIGLDHAQRIAYRTEQLLNSSANYAMARSMSIQAARELYGLSSCEEIAVTRAWFAVGVGANYTGTVIVPITGSSSFCIGSQNYTINTGIVTNWSVSPLNIVTLNASGNNATLTKLQDGIVTLTATIQNACGTLQIISATKTIKVGFPYFSNPINGTILAAPYGHYTYSQPLPLNFPIPDYYLWRVPAGWNILSGQGTSNVYIEAGTVGGNVEVDVTACVITRLNHKYVDVGSGGGIPDVVNGGAGIPELVSQNAGGLTTKLTVYPNPTNNYVLITLLTENINKTKESYIQKIKIIDKTGIIKRHYDFNNGQKKQNIDLSFLPADVYFINVFDGEKWLQAKLIVVR